MSPPLRSPPSAPHRRPTRWLASGVRLLGLGRVLLVAAGVATGAWLVAGPDLLAVTLGRPALLALLSATLVAVGAAVLRTDRAGRLAQGSWAVATGGGLLLSGFVSGVHLAMALGASALLYLLARRPPMPSAWRPTGAGMAAAFVVVYGGWSVGPSGDAFVGAAFVFLGVTAHQLIRRIERSGAGASAEAEREDAQAAGFALGLTISLSALPYLVLGYGGLYLLTACGADLLMLRTAYLLALRAPRSYATRARALLQGALVVGLAALAFASV